MIIDSQDTSRAETAADPAPRPLRGKTIIAGVLLLLTLSTTWILYLGAYQVDDAYIVYRYARNLATGHGFVFNPGERVEGVSCFLWTVVLTPFSALPLPKVASVLTITCALTVLLLLPGLSARLRHERQADALDWCAPLLLAANPGFSYWADGGLETVPFAALLVLTLRSYLDEKRSGGRQWSALFASLALLTRPETPLLLGALVADMLWGRPRGPKARVARWVAAVGGTFSAFLVFRRMYFGDWLPNTYYAKSGSPIGETLLAGWNYHLRFFADWLPSLGGEVPWLGLVVFSVVLVHGLIDAKRRPAGTVLLLLAAAIVFDGGDWMFLYRFWVPGLPLLYVLLISLLRSTFGTGRRGLTGSSLVVALLLAHSVVRGFEERSPAGLLHPSRPGTESYAAIGRFLTEHTQPGDAVALMDIGQLGYETDLHIVDISGLVDRTIAKSPGGFLQKEYPVSYLLDQQPRFFVLRPDFWIDWRILQDETFSRRYLPVWQETIRGTSQLVVYMARAEQP